MGMVRNRFCGMVRLKSGLRCKQGHPLGDAAGAPVL